MHMTLVRSHWPPMNRRVARFFTCCFLYIAIFFISSHKCSSYLKTNSAQDDTSKIVPKDPWSEWSEWAPCSRTCDGGISVSLRKCLSKAECEGNAERFKLCNMQPCSLATDFRAQQCAAFNEKPYRERFYDWLPYIDPTDPCSLTCKAKTLNFVAKLAPSVKDGTRCQSGSLSMCVAGKCLSVGCDLQLGSSAKIDVCGICGGDGTSCGKHRYSWSHRFFTGCSHSCGGGLQRSNVTCVNEDTDTVVDDIFCILSSKPPPEIKSCNDFDCPPTWVVEEWSKCECTTGKRWRKVRCSIEFVDRPPKAVPDLECTEVKPVTEEICNRQECPLWYEGLWSECSESCGNGIQTRPVVCRDFRGIQSDECELELKPPDTRNCSDISKCLQNKVNSQEDSPQFEGISNKVTTEPSFIVGSWSPCNVSCGMGNRSRVVECKIFLEFSKTVVTIPESQCPGEKPPEVEVCYEQECENSLVDLKYIGGDKQRPNEELSYQVLKETSYIWQLSDYSKCSLPCLGGTQEARFECFRLPDNVTVDHDFCGLDLRPDSYTRTCNDHPCPPKWNISEWNDCSKPCGQGGMQSRIVRCVHEVARGSTNVVIIPDNECESPMPSTQQACNKIDCPARWIVGHWSKCSKDCGGGLKRREIHCKKEFSSDGMREVSLEECPFKRPKILKTCNLKPCRAFLGRNLNNELSRSKSKRNNNLLNPGSQQDHVALKVEGRASVFEFTLVKLFCPEWTDDGDGTPTKVSWTKGNERIHAGKRYHLFRNVLKMKRVHLNDTAVYKCWQHPDTYHSMFLQVLPRMDNESAAHDMSNLVLNDYSKQAEPNKRNYYQNELDLSQEMQLLSAKGNSLKRRNHVQKGRNANNIADSDDSWEVNKPRSQQALHYMNESVNPKEKISTHTEGPKSSLPKKKPLFPPIGDDNLKDFTFNWITTEYTRCTIPCGGVGFKMRLVQCYAQLGNITQAVESSFCTEHGLEQPKSVERCGFLQCTLWKTGQWSECDNCISLHRGLQTRSVNCLLTNGTVVQDWHCLQLNPKPDQNKECLNVNCVAHWSNSTFSSCNRNGQRTRQIQCVWKATQKPAPLDQCNALKRPPTTDRCFTSFEEDQ